MNIICVLAANTELVGMHRHTIHPIKVIHPVKFLHFCQIPSNNDGALPQPLLPRYVLLIVISLQTTMVHIMMILIVFCSGKEGAKLVSDIDSMVRGPRYTVISTCHYGHHQPRNYLDQFKVP